MTVLLITATEAEAGAFRQIEGVIHHDESYSFGGMKISLLVTGPGAVPCAWHFMNHIHKNGKPDLTINFGIAGSFRDDIPIGTIVIPERDCFADYGVEDGENFFSLFESGIAGKDEFPFKDGWIHCPIGKFSESFVKVRAITRGTGTGSEKTVNMLSERYNPDIETMEGASFFYICKRESIPFIALRTISNKVEHRNRSAWNIPLALGSLSIGLKKILLLIEE